MLSKSEAKYIQTLSQKKLREVERRFIIEGSKMVAEALQKKGVVDKVFALEDWMRKNDTLIKGIHTETIKPFELEKISQLKTPNNVLAIARMEDKSFEFEKKDLALALDCIQDPGNMGTIIRIADWFGIRQIICSKDCADAYNPKVVQATMGSILRVQLFYTDLPTWFHQQDPVNLYAAALSGTPLKNVGKIDGGIIVIGNESKGISNDILSLATQKITIEKWGDAESLNAAVATGIILSQVR